MIGSFSLSSALIIVPTLSVGTTNLCPAPIHNGKPMIKRVLKLFGLVTVFLSTGHFQPLPPSPNNLSSDHKLFWYLVALALCCYFIYLAYDLMIWDSVVTDPTPKKCCDYLRRHPNTQPPQNCPKMSDKLSCTPLEKLFQKIK